MSDLKQILLEARYALRLSQIPRWTVVEMSRVQSVAEHSYNVVMLSVSLWDYITEVVHNSFDRQSLIEWALIHDMEEVETSDLPSNVKQVLNKIHPGISTQLKEQMLSSKYPKLMEHARGIKGSVVWDVVKLAETVECIIYLDRYAIDAEHAREVRAYLVQGLTNIYNSARLAHHRPNWDRAASWIHGLIPLEVSLFPFQPKMVPTTGEKDEHVDIGDLTDRSG